MTQILKLIFGTGLLFWFITAQANGKTLAGIASRQLARTGVGRIAHK